MKTTIDRVIAIDSQARRPERALQCLTRETAAAESGSVLVAPI